MTSLEKQDETASGGGGTSLTISDCQEVLTDAQLGDSICVNGKEYAIFPDQGFDWLPRRYLTSTCMLA